MRREQSLRGGGRPSKLVPASEQAAAMISNQRSKVPFLVNDRRVLCQPLGELGWQAKTERVLHPEGQDTPLE